MVKEFGAFHSFLVTWRILTDQYSRYLSVLGISIFVVNHYAKVQVFKKRSTNYSDRNELLSITASY